jgi:hypothetical protein
MTKTPTVRIFVQGNTALPKHAAISQTSTDRCMKTVKGHPTWKLFCGDISNPSTEIEPCHHVYRAGSCVTWLSEPDNYHKLTYYYYTEPYVNFNELVTDLFKQYKVKRGGEKHVGES